jgi:hypothetical protein
MIIPPEQKNKLTKVVAILPADSATKQNWLKAIQQDDVPKDVLFDIAATIAALDESRDELKKADKETVDFFNEMRQDQDDRDEAIDTKLTALEKEVKELEQEFGAEEETPTAAETPAPAAKNDDVAKNDDDDDLEITERGEPLPTPESATSDQSSVIGDRSEENPKPVTSDPKPNPLSISYDLDDTMRQAGNATTDYYQP